jgi:hypothetical protein
MYSPRALARMALPILVAWIALPFLSLSLALGAANTPGAVGVPIVPAEGVSPTLTATSQKQVLAPSETVSSWLVLAAPVGASIDLLDFTWMSTTGVEVTLPDLPSSLPPGQSMLAVISMVGPKQGITAGDVALSLRYLAHPTTPEPSGTGATGVNGVVVATIALEPSTASATVEIRSATGAVSAIRPGTVDVLVTNTSSAPATIAVVARPNPALAIKPASYVSPDLVPPGDTVTAEFTVSAADQINPGETLAIFDVTTSGRAGTNHAVASIAPNLAVFGVSEFSGPLGIPTFYLAPGLIMLVSWGLLQSLFGRVRKAVLGGPDAKEFWVVGIALSLAMAFVFYPAITALLAGWFGLFGGVGRDYLRGFGSLDVALVWFMSLLIPIVVYLPIRGTQAYLHRHVPTANDSPWKVIERLAGTGLTVGVPVVTTKQSKGLLLEPRRSGQASYWIGPQIGIRWQRPPNAGVDLEQGIDSQLEVTKSIKDLWPLLNTARSLNYIELHWMGADSSSGPELVAAADMTFGPAVRLVTKDEESEDA